MINNTKINDTIQLLNSAVVSEFTIVYSEYDYPYSAA